MTIFKQYLIIRNAKKGSPEKQINFRQTSQMLRQRRVDSLRKEFPEGETFRWEWSD